MKRLVYVLLIVGACALSLAATKSRYVRYDQAIVGSSTNRHFVPTHLGSAFRPSELNIGIDAGTCYVTVYIGGNGPLGATDSFNVTTVTTGAWEYVGPMSDTMRVSTLTTTGKGMVRAFK